MNIKGRHFLKLLDFTPEEINGLVELAARLKADKKAGVEKQMLKGKNIVLLFEKDSTRTRCAFEVGAHDQGAHVTYLGPTGSQMGKKESIADTARVLGRMYDGIEYRGYGQNLVEDLFEYTKVQQHGSPVNIMKIDLNQLLEQLTASFELEAQHKGIEITSSVEPNPLMIEADPEKLGRVFSNLVANALKYGNGASYIKVAAHQKQDQVVVKVSNDGTPIPAKSIEHLFERFYRAEGSRSRATGGTGLGLAIVKSIVDLHHGNVQVTSDDNETSFIVTLPLKQKQPKKKN